MEHVLQSWGRDYILSPLKSKAGEQNFDVRIFKVKAEGHCLERANNGWVSNKLTLIEEVSQEEIIDYFRSKPELIDKVIQRYKNDKMSEDIWTEYTRTKIVPYKQIIDEREIEESFIANCKFRKIGHCEYKLDEATMMLCKECNCYSFYQEHRQKEYNYLFCRSLILRNVFEESCESYQYLLERGAKKELAALTRLINSRKTS